jgi:hypothetical protein
MQSACLFGVDSDAWRSWCNFHSLMFRHGLCLHDLDPSRRDLVFALMQATLSERGFAQARDVMRMNRHLGEVTGNFAAFDEWYYWISIMGVPSPTAPWGWQIDGQHLAINCLVVGDQLVVSPTFFGAEPTRAESGAYAGLVLFAEEEGLGLRLMRALDEPQRQRATIGRELPFDVFAHSFNDNIELDYQGLPARDMTAAQRDMLLDLIRCYIERETPGHAALRLRDIVAHLDATHFAWIGDWGEGPFYYRIHGPMLLVEFDHQPGVTFANDTPSRRHIHTVLRTPNGNDYGKALIAQYYERARRTPLRADAGAAEAYDIRRHGKPMGVLSE